MHCSLLFRFLIMRTKGVCCNATGAGVHGGKASGLALECLLCIALIFPHNEIVVC